MGGTFLFLTTVTLTALSLIYACHVGILLSVFPECHSNFPRNHLIFPRSHLVFPRSHLVFPETLLEQLSSYNVRLHMIYSVLISYQPGVIPQFQWLKRYCHPWYHRQLWPPDRVLFCLISSVVHLLLSYFC